MLTVVPTPIGNLEDMTLRGIRLLKEVDLIACEDTRTSRILLDRYGISSPTTSYHEHNARKKTERLVDKMQRGTRVALISDAGTPGISDPGFVLIRACLEADVGVEVLPGATALAPALVLSGLPLHRFAFEGFLPQRKGRKTRIESLADESRTMIFFESPHRLLRTLRDLAEVFGPERSGAVCRELSKRYEETLRGSLGELIEILEKRSSIKGEIVVVVEGGT